MLIMFEAVSVCCGGLDKLDQFSDFNIVKYWGNHEEMLSAAACCDDVCPSGKKQLAVREGNGTPLQYSCRIYYLKKLHISGPTKFKPVLFKGQPYSVYIQWSTLQP